MAAGIATVGYDRDASYFLSIARLLYRTTLPKYSHPSYVHQRNRIGMFAGVTPEERRRGQSRRCNGPNLIGPHKGDNQIRRQRLARTRPRRADLIVNAFWRESGKAARAEAAGFRDRRGAC